MSSTEKHIIAENPELLYEIDQAYGDEQIPVILDALVASYDMVHDYLPLLEPVQHIDVDLADVHGVFIGARGSLVTKESRLKLIINTLADVQNVIMELPDVSLHEGAHLAHAQHNPTFMEERAEPKNLHFASAIHEGISLTIGREFGAFNSWPFSKSQRKKVLDALIDTLYDPESDQYKTYGKFMTGTADFSNPGYHMGELVVGTMFKKEALTIDELLQVSLSEFRTFAEFGL